MAQERNGSEKPLRLFAAVPAPPAVREAALRLADELRGAGDVRWVRPENLHLTLKFLGPTPPEKVPALQKLLEEKANTISIFVVQLGGAGAFPNLRRPQTLWLGVEGDLEPLRELAAEVDRAASALGFPGEDRPFRPHLSIGRVKSPRGASELRRRLEEMGPPEPVEWPVRQFQLVRSDLRPDGPVYTVLHDFPLR